MPDGYHSVLVRAGASVVAGVSVVVVVGASVAVGAGVPGSGGKVIDNFPPSIEQGYADRFLSLIVDGLV